MNEYLGIRQDLLRQFYAEICTFVGPAAPFLFSSTFNAHSSLTVKDHLSLSDFSFFVFLPSAVTSLWPISQSASIKHWAITMGALLCIPV